MIIVLSQIAFTYFLSYLIMQWKWRWQVVTAVGLLVFWMALLFAFPGPDGPYSKTGHVGLVVDRWIFHYDYDPAYSTLNFIASTVWTLTGVWTGQLLMGPLPSEEKLKRLAAGMAFSFAAGLLLGVWIPMIKQLCTPSFVLYSLGWVLLMLIGFYVVIEVLAIAGGRSPSSSSARTRSSSTRSTWCCASGWTTPSACSRSTTRE